ncbi:hypothetical protein [uncultured Mediterranean phage uvDeep-CGR2-KM18-C269]|nr:hypothetical protein [uncultured Mediterranean phage uvDeep-CGR2-KM18-C269]
MLHPKTAEKKIDGLINENRKLKSLLIYIYSVVQSVKSNNPSNAMMGLDIIDDKMDKDYDIINDWR